MHVLRENKRLTRHCEVWRCTKATTWGKPWCSAHTHTHSPYALQVAREHEEIERARDSERASNRDIEDEVLSVVIGGGGTATLARVAKWTQTSRKLAELYLIRLQRRGLVSLGTNKRKALTATLTHKGRVTA